MSEEMVDLTMQYIEHGVVRKYKMVRAREVTEQVTVAFENGDVVIKESYVLDGSVRDDLVLYLRLEDAAHIAGRILAIVDRETTKETKAA